MDKLIAAVRELLENRAEEYLHPDDRKMLHNALDKATREQGGYH